MRLILNRILQWGLSFLTSGRLGRFLARVGSRKLIDQITGKVTDEFLELLLRAMNLAFRLIKSYRKNIENFTGSFLFCTSDNQVAVSVMFKNGRMTVSGDGIDDWNVKIIFRNAGALCRFLFSKNQDIINSILSNDVVVRGNLNYVYRFGFMVRELAGMFGIK